MWLGSTESGDVTGRVFEVEGGMAAVAGVRSPLGRLTDHDGDLPVGPGLVVREVCVHLDQAARVWPAPPWTPPAHAWVGSAGELAR